MVKESNPWVRLLITGLMLLLAGIRTPDVLAERSWRSWAVLPVLLIALWLFVRALRDVVTRRNRVSADRDAAA
ncbi:hypothetical protein ACQPWW_22925 [Micromonospora sp. CA-240977]|uniref:hypothetical protein n=1 Tax=Micromonospora sp. CA-240977 TaxID=3239957 RepID=UPI003D93EE27